MKNKSSNTLPLTVTQKPYKVKNIKNKDMKRAARLLHKLKSQVYEGTEASQMILSMEENMVDLFKTSADFDAKKFLKRAKGKFLSTQPTSATEKI